MKDCLKKRGLDVRQVRIMLDDKSVVCEGECIWYSPEDKPLTLTGCYSYEI